MCFYSTGNTTPPTTPKPNDKKRLGVFLPAGLLFSPDLSSVLQLLSNNGTADPVDTLYVDAFSMGTDHLARPEFTSQVVSMLKQWRGAGSSSGLLNYKKRVFAWYRPMHWGSTPVPDPNWLLKPDTGAASDNWLTPYNAGYVAPKPPAQPAAALCQEKKCDPNVYLAITALVKTSIQYLNANSLISGLITGVHLDDLRAPVGADAEPYKLTLAAQGEQIRSAFACMACEIRTFLMHTTTPRTISISQLNLQNTFCLEDAILPLVKFDEIIPIIDDLLNNTDPHPDLTKFTKYNNSATRVMPQVNLVNNKKLVQPEVLARLYKEAHLNNGLIIGLSDDPTVSYTSQVQHLLQTLASVQKQVTFSVNDDMGKPVPNASIEVRDPYNNTQFLQSDVHGQAKIPVIDGEKVVLQKVKARNKQVKKEPIIS